MCIFCDIINKKIPAKIILETPMLIVINDHEPKAPYHLLIIPKKHIATLNNLTSSELELVSNMLLTAKELAISLGINESGYRLIFNVNADGGQTVYHIHLHLLGGRPLTWPPG